MAVPNTVFPSSTSQLIFHQAASPGGGVGRGAVFLFGGPSLIAVVSPQLSHRPDEPRRHRRPPRLLPPAPNPALASAGGEGRGGSPQPPHLAAPGPAAAWPSAPPPRRRRPRSPIRGGTAHLLPSSPFRSGPGARRRQGGGGRDALRSVPARGGRGARGPGPWAGRSPPPGRALPARPPSAAAERGRPRAPLCALPRWK